MSKKIVDLNGLDQLAKALDSRAKTAVNNEKIRAEAEETELNQRIDTVNSSLANKSDKGHAHDDVYRKISDSYSKVEVNGLVDAKADSESLTSLQTTLEGQIATAKQGAISTAATDASNKDKALKTELTSTITTGLAGKSDTGHTHNDVYYTEDEVDELFGDYYKKTDTYNKTEIDASLGGKASSSHTHDDRYFTETEVTNKLAGKSDTGHKHEDDYYNKTIMDSKIQTLKTTDIANAKSSAISDAKDYTDEKISALVGSAPEAMNTLQELAKAISDHQTVYDAYVETVSGDIATAKQEAINAANTNAASKDTALHTTISKEIDDDIAAATQALQANIDKKSDEGHTHKYAGSSSAGGAATSANKVNSNLVVKLNSGTTEGTNLFTFNGSAAKTVNITPDGIGAAKASHGTHVEYSTSAPKVAGTAATGSATTVSRSDHVHPAQTSVSGNAGTATKLAAAKTLTIGNKGYSFDGSGNVSWTLAEIGASAEGHTHNYAGSASAGGAANSVKTNLIIKFNNGATEGTNLFTFNGSTAKTLNINPANIGAAASSHGTHVTYGTAKPLAPIDGGATGSASTVARSDHQHPLQTTISGAAGSAGKLTTARTLTIGNAGKSFDGSANVAWTLAEIGAAASSHNHTNVNNVTHSTSIYNPANGVLIDFNMNEKSGAMVYLKIVGNSYSDKGPVESVYQFYDYASGNLNQLSGICISGDAIKLTVMRADGKLKAWFAQTRSYESFRVEVSYANNTSTPNVTLTNVAKPTTGVTESVDITPYQVYSSKNKPTPAAIGAAPASKSVVTKTASSNVITLSKDQYQVASGLTNGGTINLPTVSGTTIVEINLFVNNVSLSSLQLPDNCVWRVDPNLEVGKYFMFTFLWNGTIWLAEAKIYS